ncbi:MAG: transcription termination/antitermination protein NusA, partial [Dehalococcoidia bacterium]|nr:transcription termination/antitermination protein NusA [Dehalococcoidia bacterium]
ESGEPRVFAIKLVVEEVEDSVLETTLPEALEVDSEATIGASVRIEITPQNFGRIGAQAAKQSIMQRLREAERDHVYHDFIDREGDIISGIFRRAEPRGMIIDLGRAEALLPPGEQVMSERFRIGARLRTLLLEVNRAPRGYLLVASRANKVFVRRLLELEIPEIYNGSVEIRAIAREPGSRTKVAVQSRQVGLDPVGACVGQRGIRIQNVVNEIGGEKIDVVQWHDDAATMVGSALGPARVVDVELSEEDKTAYVTVPHAQLSLAIGKEGQNARLAARLTGWRVDIKSDQPPEEGEEVVGAVASPSDGVEESSGPDGKV